MEHEAVSQLLPAYVDQELGVVDALAVERHLESCDACRREVEEQRSVGLRLRAGAARFDAPPALRARISAAFPADRPSRAPAPGPAHTRPWLARWQAWRQAGWLAAATALALVFALGWGLGASRAPSAQDRQTEDLVASHVRSLQADHLADVASSDQHTVKPWFIGKLNFAPPVVDLSAQGFPLVGGRLDYLGGHDVAVLVYRRNRHPINLYVWPGGQLPAAPRTTRANGYHLVRWSEGGMDYSAVSDVAEGDLAQFVQSVRAHTGP